MVCKIIIKKDYLGTIYKILYFSKKTLYFDWLVLFSIFNRQI